MRKAVVFSLLLFAFSNGFLRADVHFGVKLGVGMSSYAGSGWMDALSNSGSKSKISPSGTVGFLMNYSFHNSLALQVETLFSTLAGGEYDLIIADYNFNYVIRELAVEIPFYLQYGLQAGPGDIVFSAGPEIFITLGNLYETGNYGLNKTYKASEYYDNVFRGTMCYGIGYQMDHWQALLIYKRGFTSQFDEASVVNQNMSLEAAYLF